MAKNEAYGDDPEITDEHKRFDRRITAHSLLMAEEVVERVVTVCGEPPTQTAKRALYFFAHHSQDFKGEGQSDRSRLVPTFVGGGDYLAMGRVILPSEAQTSDLSGEIEAVRRDATYLGRIIDLSILYGGIPETAYSWEGRLFTGPDTPPVIAEKRKLAQHGCMDIELGELFKAQGRLPKSLFLRPDHNELLAIRQALVAVEDDINVPALLEGCRANAVDENRTQDIDWFIEQETVFRRQGMGD